MDPERLKLETRLAAIELLLAQLILHQAAQTADPSDTIVTHRQAMRRAVDEMIRRGAEASALPVVSEELADAIDRILAQAESMLAQLLGSAR
jgi:hypothetical protein